MITEGARINYLNKEISKLEAILKNVQKSSTMMDKELVSSSLIKRIEKLKNELGNWEKIYSVVASAPDIIPNEIDESIDKSFFVRKDKYAILTNNPVELHFAKLGERSHVEILKRLFAKEIIDLTNKFYSGKGEDDEPYYRLVVMKKILRIIIDNENLYFNTFGSNSVTKEQLRFLKDYCIKNNLILNYSMGRGYREIELNETITNPPAIIQTTNSFGNIATNQNFINFVKTIENSQKSGFKNGKWYPHKSFEGGLPTIGYGHKIKNKRELNQVKNGISDEQTNKNLIHDLESARQKVHLYIRQKYKVNLRLTKEQEEMLTEFAFNLGGLNKFPTFIDAVLRNNWDVARKEYKRYSGGKELKIRNELFYNRYLQPQTNPINEGIYLTPAWGGDPELFCQLDHDKESNVINLLPTKYNTRLHKFKNINLFIGYYFNKKYSTYSKKMGNWYIRKILKSLDFEKIVYCKGEEMEWVYGKGEKILNRMIDNSINRFSQLVDLNSFDLIIPAPSSAPLNNLIVERFSRVIKNKESITNDIFLKNSINKIAYYREEYNKLSHKGKILFSNAIRSILRKGKNREEIKYEIKMMPPTMRHLIHNFIGLKKDKKTINVINKLNSDKILIIDDTIGSGSTFLEIIREIQPYKPKEIYLYAFLKDYK